MFRRDRRMITEYTRPELVNESVELSGDDHKTEFDYVPMPRADWPHNSASFWNWVERVFQ